MTVAISQQLRLKSYEFDSDEQSTKFIDHLQDEGALPYGNEIDDTVLCYARKALVLYCGRSVVGMIRFKCSGGKFAACGTWVRRGWRDRGIATKLWQAALKQTEPHTVVVTTVSANGHRLVESLRYTFPFITWCEN